MGQSVETCERCNKTLSLIGSRHRARSRSPLVCTRGHVQHIYRSRVDERHKRVVQVSLRSSASLQHGVDRHIHRGEEVELKAEAGPILGGG